MKKSENSFKHNFIFKEIWNFQQNEKNKRRKHDFDLFVKSLQKYFPKVICVKKCLKDEKWKRN